MNCKSENNVNMSESAIWDTEHIILARNRGWLVSTLPPAKALHKRVTYTRKGKIKGYWRLGKIAYYAYTHPIVVVATGIIYTIENPFINGFVYLISYINSCLQKGERTTNQEVRNHYQSLGRVLSKLNNVKQSRNRTHLWVIMMPGGGSIIDSSWSDNDIDRPREDVAREIINEIIKRPEYRWLGEILNGL